MTQALVHPSDAVLGDFQLGKLTDPEHADIESHLSECPECQERAAAIRTDDSLIGLLAGCAAPDPGLGSAATPAASSETQGWDTSAATRTGDEAVPDSLSGHPKYQAVRRLGVGGMGTVWLAQHALMNRPVAVKVIRPELLARPGATDRFLREVRAAAKLHHPNIVTAFDAEPVGHSCLLVMEYVDGETLADRVKAGPLPVVEACRAAQDAARGLAHAHAAGLVHRDVKPHNLIVAADGTTKVLDFGLAGAGVGELAAAGGENLTGAGMIFGTPDYIAPEQADDPHGADVRADVYGLGCTLYHLLAGRPPFPGESIMKKLDAHRTLAPQPIPDLPQGLAEVLAKMMAKRPDDRFQTATEAADALEPFTGRAAAKPPRRRWLVAALLLALVGLLAAAGVVYTIQRGKQEIVIKTDDPDIEVVMRRNGEVLRIRDLKSGQTWELDTVKNDIGLAEQPEGLRFELGQDPFILRREGKEVFRVARVPKPEGVEPVGEVRSWRSEQPIGSVAIAPDGRRAVVTVASRTDNVMQLLDLATGKELRRFGSHDGRATCGGFSPDGRALSHGADGTIRLWNVEGGKEVKVIPAHEKPILDAVFSPNGRLIASAADLDNGIYLWNADTGKLVRRLSGHPVAHLPYSSGWHLAFSPDSKRVLSGSIDNTARLWDVETGTELRRYQHPNRLISVAYSPDGRRILTGCDDAIVRLWDAETGALVRELKDHKTGHVLNVRFLPDGRRALSAGGGEVPGQGDFALRLWNLETGEVLHRFTGHQGLVMALDIAPNGREALTGSHDMTVRRWRLPDPPPPPPVRSFAPPPEAPGVVQALRVRTWVVFTQVAPDGRTFLVSAGDEVHLYETATGRVVLKPAGASAVYADGGRKIVTTINEGPGDRLRVYDLATGQLERTFGRLAGRTWFLYSLACANQVITWDSTRTVQVFDIKSGTEVLNWKYENENVDFTFTPDGRRLLFRPVGESRYSVCDPDTGKRTDEFAALRGLSHLRSFSADGQTIQDGLGWDEKTALIHRVADGKAIGPPQSVPEDARRHGTSPDRTRQLFLLPDGTLQLRDAVTWKVLNSVRIDLPGDYKRFRAPHNQAVTDDGRFAILNTKDNDGHVIVIRFPDPPPKP